MATVPLPAVLVNGQFANDKPLAGFSACTPLVVCTYSVPSEPTDTDGADSLWDPMPLRVHAIVPLAMNNAETQTPCCQHHRQQQ
jgi:hypothetical protein